MTPYESLQCSQRGNLQPHRGAGYRAIRVYARAAGRQHRRSNDGSTVTRVLGATAAVDALPETQRTIFRLQRSKDSPARHPARTY